MAYNNYGNKNNNGYNGYNNNNNNNGGNNNNYRKSNYGNNNTGYNTGNNNGNNQRSNSRLEKVGAIWKKMKNGKEVWSMQIGNTNYLIYPNNFKQNPNQPDFNVCIMGNNNNSGYSQNNYNNGNKGTYNNNNNATYNNNNNGYTENNNGNSYGNNYGYQKQETQQINEYNKNATPADMEQATDTEYPDLSL